MTAPRVERQEAAAFAALAAATNLSPRSVRRAIRELVALGIISRPGPGEYQINIGALEAMPRIDDDARA